MIYYFIFVGVIFTTSKKETRVSKLIEYFENLNREYKNPKNIKLKSTNNINYQKDNLYYSNDEDSNIINPNKKTNKEMHSHSYKKGPKGFRTLPKEKTLRKHLPNNFNSFSNSQKNEITIKDKKLFDKISRNRLQQNGNQINRVDDKKPSDIDKLENKYISLQRLKNLYASKKDGISSEIEEDFYLTPKKFKNEREVDLRYDSSDDMESLYSYNFVKDNNSFLYLKSRDLSNNISIDALRWKNGNLYNNNLNQNNYLNIQCKDLGDLDIYDSLNHTKKIDSHSEIKQNDKDFCKNSDGFKSDHYYEVLHFPQEISYGKNTTKVKNIPVVKKQTNGEIYDMQKQNNSLLKTKKKKHFGFCFNFLRRKNKNK
ncbi:hypothetical protein H312_00604 [Anncaliia algerae PRA339]|uniref:Uncharacterized protein n=1 Tax=Anncaliia algerae PRA339 TaxID=1288291 RepID=A0A059F4R8_9MICR|nr:hypothetical protein H312_00604 [Anncaliia algerae PRA339]